MILSHNYDCLDCYAFLTRFLSEIISHSCVNVTKVSGKGIFIFSKGTLGRIFFTLLFVTVTKVFILSIRVIYDPGEHSFVS